MTCAGILIQALILIATFAVAVDSSSASSPDTGTVDKSHPVATIPEMPPIPLPVLLVSIQVENALRRCRSYWRSIQERFVWGPFRSLQRRLCDPDNGFSLRLAADSRDSSFVEIRLAPIDLLLLLYGAIQRRVFGIPIASRDLGLYTLLRHGAVFINARQLHQCVNFPSSDRRWRFEYRRSPHLVIELIVGLNLILSSGLIPAGRWALGLYALDLYVFYRWWQATHMITDCRDSYLVSYVSYWLLLPFMCGIVKLWVDWILLPFLSRTVQRWSGDILLPFQTDSISWYAAMGWALVCFYLILTCDNDAMYADWERSRATTAP